MSIVALIGLLQFRVGFDLTRHLIKIPVLQVNGNYEAVLARGGFGRPAGTATHPIEFGVVVASTIAFALHLLLYDHAWPRSRRIIALVLLAAAVPAALSRSAILVIVTVLVFFFVGTTPHNRIRSLLALPVAAAALFVSTPGIIGSLSKLVLGAGSDPSIQTRTSDYAAVAHYFRTSPIIGRGPGTFLPTYRLLDNQYLLTLIELGTAGLIALLWLLTIPYFLGRGARRRSRTEGNRNLGQMLAAVGTCAALSSFTYDAFSFPMFTVFTALVTGLAGAMWGISRSSQGVEETVQAGSADQGHAFL
jgi:O-antigen ligase